MVVDAADGQQDGNRHALGGSRAVGQDQDVAVFLHALFGFQAKLVDARLHARIAACHRPGAIEYQRGETVFVEVLDLLELVLEQNRAIEADGVAVFGGFLEQVAFRPQSGTQRHHRPFADRVDRRVGHLRKELFEIGEKQAGVTR